MACDGLAKAPEPWPFECRLCAPSPVLVLRARWLILVCCGVGLAIIWKEFLAQDGGNRRQTEDPFSRSGNDASSCF